MAVTTARGPKEALGTGFPGPYGDRPHVMGTECVFIMKAIAATAVGKMWQQQESILILGQSGIAGA